MSVPKSGQQHGRLGALDCLRLLAALGVLAFHFTALDSPAWDGTVPPEAMNGIKRFSAYGTLGVPLFFVISGFVILMSAWGRSIPAFLASRIGRIYPAYWVAAAGSVVLVLFLWRDNFVFDGITAPQALLNLTMLQGAFGVRDIDGVYWTLWYEARFYLLIAVLLWVGMTRQRVLAFAALWPVVGAMADQADSSFLTTLLMPDFSPFFAGGMLLYVIYRDGHELVAWLLVGLQALLGIYQVAPVYLNSITTYTGTYTTTARLAVFLVGCFALVALATMTRAASWGGRWTTVAGALTYPVYLLHENFGWFTIHHLHDRLGAWGSVLVATALVLVAAFALHHFVEKPFGPRLRRATLRMLASAELPQKHQAGRSRRGSSIAVLRRRHAGATTAAPVAEEVPAPDREADPVVAPVGALRSAEA